MADAHPQASSTTAPAAQVSLSALAKPVFLAWEKLRIVYVLVLAVVSLWALPAAGWANAQYWGLLVQGAIVANVLYFAGPIVETYIRWLGYDRLWVRWLMFVGGTLFSVFLAVRVLTDVLLPDQF